MYELRLKNPAECEECSEEHSHFPLDDLENWN